MLGKQHIIIPSFPGKAAENETPNLSLPKTRNLHVHGARQQRACDFMQDLGDEPEGYILGAEEGGVPVKGEVVGDALVVWEPAVGTDHALLSHGHLNKERIKMNIESFQI